VKEHRGCRGRLRDGAEARPGLRGQPKRERTAGRVPTLAPGETRRISLDFTLLNSKVDIAKAAAAIEAIQSGRRTTMNPETIKPVN